MLYFDRVLLISGQKKEIMSGLLEICRSPPSSDYVTVMEKNGEMKYVSSNMAEPLVCIKIM